MTNVSDDFRDFLMRHAHDVARYENGVIASMYEPYHRAKGELYNKIVELETSIPTGTTFTRQWRIDRLNQQLADVEGMIHSAALDSAGTLNTALRDFANSEGEVYQQMLRSKFGTVGINISDIPFEQIEFITQNPLIYQYRGITPADGMLWTNREAVDMMRTELTQSVIQGEGMAQAARRLTGAGRLLGGDVGRRIASKASIIARSEIQHISNEVARAIYRGNRDVLKGVTYLATLDNRTCLLKNTLVTTSDGEKKIQDIKVGDKVLTHKNRYRNVIAKQKLQKKKYLKVKLSNGKELKITHDDEVLTKNGWTEIGKMKVGDKICKIKSV